MVTTGTALAAADVERLTEWRNRYRSAFLTEFTATNERTERWLRETVGPSDQRILFMLDDLEGRTFGYMGLAQINWDTHSGEADAVVRGLEAPPGTMRVALRTMLLWAESQLGLTTLRVRVRSDNPAVAFYRRVGFVESHQIPLRQQRQGTELHWIEDASADSGVVGLVYMNWQPNSEC
ncbi:MAG: GNAT family N-acetyltransferase [Verrucomicrobia bacterium]|nr:GNAT family N-acetyltransferase [Verrucomicrobiota bacterium]